MNIEDQVCSLELARKLKKLGIKQESLVFWLKIQSVVHFKRNEKNECEFDENGGVIVENIEYEYQLGNPYAQYVSKYVSKEDCWSAFTVAELGEMLPEEVDTFKGNRDWKWECSFHRGNNYHNKSGANIEADARAKMLIFLLENNLMEVPK